MVGFAVTGEDEPEGAGVGTVKHPEAVGGRLDLDHRPDGAVDGGERAEALHHLGVGLVDQLAGQAAVGVGIEVAVGEQQRQFVRRSLG